jgi:manganese/zinc/iron transport system ATP- binding protein
MYKRSSMNRTPVPALEFSHVTVGYERKKILHDISITIDQGMLLGIAGPNGAGKSTFIKTALNLLPLWSGYISILGKKHTHALGQVAYIPQRNSIDWNFPATVFDMVLMGTYRELGWFKRPGKAEYERTYQALDAVELTEHADTSISELSGGQQQRAFLARALTQKACIYLLDEPFNGIDQHAQTIILALFKKLQEKGDTLIVVHHDLQTITQQFDHLLLLNQGIVAYGPTHTVITPQYICAAYNQTEFTSNRSFT